MDDPKVLFIKFWLKFLEPMYLFDLMDFISNQADAAKSLAVDLLVAILHSMQLSNSLESQSAGALQMRLNKLMALRPLLKNDLNLEHAIAVAVNSSLPIGHNGLASSAMQSRPLASLISQAKLRWCHHTDAAINENYTSFLTQENWSDSTIQIISGLLYRSSFSGGAFCQWLGTENCASRATYDLARVLQTFLDTSYVRGYVVSDEEGESLVAQIPKLLAVVADPESTSDLRNICASCIILAVSLMPSQQFELLALLASRVQLLPINSFTTELLLIGNRLHSVAGANDLISNLANHGLQWTVPYLSDDSEGTYDTQSAFKELGRSLSPTCS
jgi:nucleolar pre-ribosomal-associated protein 1